MPKYVVFNTVNWDGVGDFTHFEEIMRALLANPRFSDVEFTAFVCFLGISESQYLRVEEKLKSLGIQYFYGKKEEHVKFSSEERIQRLLRDADQAISISWDEIVGIYKSYFKKGIPIKHISEHEGRTRPDIYNVPSVMIRPLGLSDGCYGIKIQDTAHISPTEAWRIISENDPDFARQLLVQTNSNDFAMFNEHYVLVPAYFNEPDPFANFLNLFVVNSSFHKDKKIVVYHSGCDLIGMEKSSIDGQDIMMGFMARGGRFKNCNIERIELFRPGHETPMVMNANPHQDGSQNIKIFSGFYINARSYDAIYQLAKIAGVSGDKSYARIWCMGKIN